MAVETNTYQLKWNSFAHHLHSSVAAAINNTTFADVSLYTFDGKQLLAHRFVLSACSVYLHEILKTQAQLTTNLPLVIILPPDINYRTMKTLLQYMYSGETTVSKDILENVLRGGDLLMVKGLWKPKDVQNNDKTPGNSQEQHSTLTSSPTPDCDPPALIHNNNKNCFNENDPLKDSDKEECDESKENREPVKDLSPVPTGNSLTLNESNSQFLVIKQEPLEWNDIEGDMLDCAENMFHSEMTIKPEPILSDTEEVQNDQYTPLSCELCSEVFNVPGAWVRHIQSHTDMLPAKRQRRGRTEDESDDGTFPPLHCDLCQTFFETPAEWVRHIENSHTEIELRISNTTGNLRPIRVNKHINSSHKMCTICNKKFPSHASMLIHKRTHTGEKPFMCDHCQKGFNVKSNLLRHLRTLHDKIINSADVEYKDENIDTSS